MKDSSTYSTVDEVMREYENHPRALIVTALPLEMDAVRGHLSDIASVLLRSGIVVECGLFNDPLCDWLVVVVESGRGNAEAQSATEHAYRAFGPFNVQLMVGVGGSLKDDVTIGSVVASERVHSIRSAKHAPDQVSSRPKSLPADVGILEIAKKVARDSEWQSRIRNPRNSKLPPRDQHYPGEWPPGALVAPVGSSEEVLADSESGLAAWLSERYGDASVIEMEGYGAMFAASREQTSAIVLRGISDMASSDKVPSKDAIRQPVAACHAAAFGFEMLRHWAASRNVDGFALPDTQASDRSQNVTSDSTNRDLDLIRTQCAKASEPLLRLHRSLPDGTEIDRSEIETIVNRIDSENSSTTILVGAPGSGKSALLTKLARKYVENEWTVLAIKSDLVDRSVSTDDELQDFLDLPMSPSDAIKTIAKSEPVLLIIDQLDALAEFIDLTTNRLGVLLGLIRKLDGLENVHIVISSRLFEFEHDFRFRLIDAECLTLELPPWSRVVGILEKSGTSANEWSPDAQEVIRSPQALAIFLELTTDSVGPFATYQQMLDALWNDRVASGEGGVERVRILVEIAETMAREESLWLASARFDQDLEHVERLVAVGILLRTEGRIGFTHQTLFEHVLARRFAQSEGALSEFVIDRQDSLFVRPKLLAGMNYLRAVELSSYHDEIEKMWSDPDLRLHIRSLIVDFLASQSRPSDREEALMGQALKSPELRWHAFREIGRSETWFDRLVNEFLEPAMLETDEASEATVGVLVSAWRSSSDRVVDLMQKMWSDDSAFDYRSWGVLSRVTDWPDEALMIAKHVLQRTDIPTHDVNYVAEMLATTQPATALRLIHARLQWELLDTQRGDVGTDVTPEVKRGAEQADIEEPWSALDEHQFENLLIQRQDLSALPMLAKAEPELFLQILWPWFDRVFRAIHKSDLDEDHPVMYAQPLVADYRFEEESEDLPPSDVLLGLSTSVEQMVINHPAKWMKWVGEIGTLEMMATHRLIAHGFAKSPERFAQESLRYLLGDERRFMLGSMMNPTGTTERLIHAAGVYWGSAELARFESALDDYQPNTPVHVVDVSNRKRWTQMVRSIKNDLRQALPNDRRNDEVQRHIDQDSRVFPNVESNTLHSFGEIGPLMDEETMEKARDDDIVNAFRTLPDATGWDHPTRFMAGGNIQLARAFAVFATKNLSRAINVIRQLTPENGTRATGNVVEAVAKVADAELVKTIIRDALNRGFDSQPFRESVSRAIARLVWERQAEVEDDLVDWLARWLKHPLPFESNGKGRVLEGNKDFDVVHESMLWSSNRVSIVPGGDFPILECLVKIWLRRGDYEKLVEMLHDYLNTCKDPDVWSHLLRFFSKPPSERQESAMTLIKRVLDEVPSVVSTVPTTRMMARAALDWAETLADQELDRWRNSESRAARQAYGEIVALTATRKEEPKWVEVRLSEIVGDPTLVEARAGVALSVAHKWSDRRSRIRTSKVIVDLLIGGDSGVWRAIFDLFRVVDKLTPDKATVELLEAMCERIAEAPTIDITFLAEQLGRLLPHEATIVGKVALGLVKSQNRTSGLAAANLVDLAITLHRLGNETRKVGTDLFDVLLEKEVHEARTTLDEIDRNL